MATMPGLVRVPPTALPIPVMAQGRWRTASNSVPRSNQCRTSPARHHGQRIPRPSGGGNGSGSGHRRRNTSRNRAKASAPEEPPVVTPLYKTRLCNFHSIGACRNGSTCSFAHGADDLRPSPDFERTSVCPAMLNNGKCDKPSCRYAHNAEELRTAPGLLKTKMCSFFLNSVCVVGEACRFAHSGEELREAVLVQRATAGILATPKNKNATLWEIRRSIFGEPPGQLGSPRSAAVASSRQSEPEEALVNLRSPRSTAVASNRQSEQEEPPINVRTSPSTAVASNRQSEQEEPPVNLRSPQSTAAVASNRQSEQEEPLVNLRALQSTAVASNRHAEQEEPPLNLRAAFASNRQSEHKESFDREQRELEASKQARAPRVVEAIPASYPAQVVNRRVVVTVDDEEDFLPLIQPNVVCPEQPRSEKTMDPFVQTNEAPFTTSASEPLQPPSATFANKRAIDRKDVLKRVVIDIEDFAAMDMDFLRTDETGRLPESTTPPLVELRRWTKNEEGWTRPPDSFDDSGCGLRKEQTKLCSLSGQFAECAMCPRGRGSIVSAPGGVACSGEHRSTPCAACGCGLKVVARNTFLTISQEEDQAGSRPRSKSL